VEVTDADGELDRDDVADTDAVAVAVRLLVALDVCVAAGEEDSEHISSGEGLHLGARRHMPFHFEQALQSRQLRIDARHWAWS